MFDIDKILGNKKHKTNIKFSNITLSKTFGSNPFSDMIGKVTNKPLKNMGASIQKQQQWKSFSEPKRNLMRTKYKDFDGDRIPNIWDCQPRNIMRQDSKPNKLMKPRFNQLKVEYDPWNHNKENKMRSRKTFRNSLYNTFKKHPDLLSETDGIEFTKDNNLDSQYTEAEFEPEFRNGKYEKGYINLLTLTNPGGKRFKHALNIKHELQHKNQIKNLSQDEYEEKFSKEDELEWKDKPMEHDAVNVEFDYYNKYNYNLPEVKKHSNIMKNIIFENIEEDDGINKLKKSQPKVKQSLKKYRENNIRLSMKQIGDGASIQKQQEWNNMTHDQRTQERLTKLDSDGDMKPDEYDCDKNNVMEQGYIKHMSPNEYTDEYLLKRFEDLDEYPKTVRLYHGTRLPEAKKIKKEGLKAQNKTGNRNFNNIAAPYKDKVFLTQNKHSAMWWAAQNKNEGKSVILEVDVPFEDYTKGLDKYKERYNEDPMVRDEDRDELLLNNIPPNQIKKIIPYSNIIIEKELRSEVSYNNIDKKRNEQINAEKKFSNIFSDKEE